MSKQVDERVVSMQFDNSHFESNVKTTLSTLDKLKQKLNLSNASTGLENVNAAAKKINMSPLSNGVEAVQAKFSALDVIGVTALANITNSAVNAGKRIVSALTIDPIKTGFEEYETQINAVQTILANTSSKGTTIDEVNAALDELNKYADLTIYNFTEMTRNIGTFTAAGVDLETSVSAIQGIANLAAVSGSTSQQASTAMYQLSQALAAGTVKLMDWNSVVNAGMGGEVFQNALKETSKLLGTGAEAAIKAKGSFRESLTTGWLTAEVLTETLKKFTTSGANEYVAEYTGLSTEAVQAALDNAEAQYGEAEAIEKASEALAQKSGKNKVEIKSALQMAKTAEDAATKVKTFTQLWDVLKEAAQSGWSATWKIIIGDFEQAKELLTPLSETLTDFINKMSDWRNNILRIGLAFAKPWEELEKKLNNISGIKKIKELSDSVEKAAHDLEYFQDIVTKVWRGDYNNHGDNPDRYDLLEKAGYDHRVVQDLVNKGYQYKLTIEDVEASHKKFGLTMESTTKNTKEASTVLSRYNDTTAKNTLGINKATDAFSNLSDEQLKQAGLTKDEIALYRALEKEANRLGISVSELAEEMSTKDGRTLLIESFKNAAEGLVGIGKAIKSAWVDIFNPPGVAELGVKLYSAIRSLNEFSEKLRLTDKDTGELNETGKKLQRTFKGVFAVLDIITTILGGGLKIAFKTLSSILGAFELNILDVTAGIGDALVAFRDWLFEGNILAKSFDWLVAKLPVVIGKLKEWFNVFKETPPVQKLVDAINAISEAFSKLTSGDIDVSEFARSLGENLAKALKSLPGIALQIGKDFIAGFQNGISSSISGAIQNVISFCSNFISSFAEALGVQSPSWKAYNIATDFFQGFINGANAMMQPVLSVLKKIGEGIVNIFKSLWDFITDESGNIEWGKIIAGGIVVSMVWFLKQIATALGGIADALGGIDDLVKNASRVLKSFSKVLNGFAWDLKAKALLKMAISIGILVAAVAVLAQIDDPAKLWNAVGVVVVLAGVLVALAFAMDKMSAASVEINKKGASLDGLKTGLLQIGIAVLLLAATVKIIGTLDSEQAEQGFIGLAGIAAGMIIFLAAIGAISRYTKDVSGFGGMMAKMAIAMLAMVAVIKIVSGMEVEDIVTGIAVMEAFVLLLAQMGLANRAAGNNGKFGSTMLAMSVSMMLMAGVIKIVSGMDPADVVVGIAVMEAFVLLLAQMGLANRAAGKNGKFGSTMLGMAASMMLLAGVIKIISGMDVGDVLKGVAIMEVFVVLIAAMLLISKLGKDTGKIAGTILAMSAAIAILAGIAVVLSLVDLGGLAKGITAVGLLSIMMTLMVKSLKGAQNVKGSILMMAISIGVMAASVTALSFIDTSKLAGATAALSILMGMFALMTKASNNVKASIGTMTIMVLVVGMLAGILAALSILDVGSTIEISASIGLLMISLAATLKLISGIEKVSMSAIGTLTLLGVIAGLIGLVLVGLSNIPNPGGTLEIAVSLSAVLLAMSAAALILSKIGPIAGAAIGSAASFLGLVVAAGAILGVIGGLVAKIDGAQEFLDRGIPIIESIGKALGSFIGGFIGGIAEGVTSSLPAIVEDIKKFVEGLSDVAESASGIKPDSFDGVGAMVKAMLNISVGSLVEHYASSITGESSMESFKQNATDFVEAIAAVSSALSNVTINEAAIETITKCGLMFTELNKALPRTGGIAQDLAGEQDLSGFGEACKAFADCMIEINNAVSQEGFAVQSETISALVAAGERFNELNTALPRTGGIAQDLAGEKDLSGFGEACKAFVDCMIEINNAVSQEGFAVNLTGMEDLKQAGLKLNELQDTLPKTGGWWQNIAGEKDIGDFGSKIKSFGEAISTFSTTADGIKKESIDLCISTAYRIKSLIESLVDLDTSGIATFTGIGTGGIGADGAAYKIAKAISTYSDEVANIDTKAVSVSVTAALKLKSLIAGLVGLDTSGIAKFKPDSIGSSMKSYANKVDGIDTGTVSKSISAANRLRTFIASLSSLDNSGISKFKVSSIGTTLRSYDASVSGLNIQSVSSSISIANRLKTFIASLAGLDAGGVSSFKTAVNELSTTNISGLVKAFSGASDKLVLAGSKMIEGLANGMRSKIPSVKLVTSNVISSIDNEVKSKISSFKQVGGSMMTSMSGGISSKKGAAVSAMSSCVSQALSAISGYYGSFHSAGSYLVSGFASGISSNAYRAVAQAAAMAKAAEKAAKNALGIHSPSVAFREIGSYIVQGLSEGITKDTSAEDAIKKKAQNITTAFNTEFEKLDVADTKADLTVELGINSADEAYASKYASQLERISLAEAQYAEMSKQLGEASIETKKAQNTLFRQKADLSKLKQEYTKEEYEQAIESLDTDIKKLDLADTQTDLTKALKGINDEFNAASIYTAKYNRQLERITLTQKKYDETVKLYGESSAEAQEAYNEVLQEQVDLQSMVYDHSKDWIEQQKALGNFSLIDELSAWKRVQNTYAEGTEQRIEADSQILSLEEQIESANNDYYNNVIDRTKELSEAQDELTQKYKDALEERKNAIVDSYGLFDKVEEKEQVDGSTLIDNLMGQLENNMLWSRNMNSLSDRGILSDDLITKLREMGPSVSSEIEALSSMTDFELEKYNRIWEANNKTAENQAAFELQGLKDEIAEENKTLIEEYNSDLETMRTDWLKGLGIMSEDTATAFSTLVEESINTVGNEEKWSEAGADTIHGILKGVSENENLLHKAMSTLGDSLLTTFNNALGIASPSKEFAKAGKFIDQGLIIGILNNAKGVYDSVSDLGSDSIKSFTDVLSRLSDVVSGDMDVQPVISPVIDLSDAQAGARAINGMFGNSVCIGAAGNIGAISSMMNARIQNGVNNDVVSAINRLRDRIDNVGGPTYNINGITYDDGSNIADAIETLVRAAKIERRT